MSDINYKYLLLLVVLIIITCLLIFQCGKKFYESFDTQEKRELDIPIAPMLYDRQTGEVMASHEFIALPDEILPPWGGRKYKNAKYGVVDGLDDGANGDMSMAKNMCSKSCCSQQWPVPFPLEKDAMVEKLKDKFVPNGYSCNNAWQDSGCLCMTKDQRDFLDNHGNNQ